MAAKPQTLEDAINDRVLECCICSEILKDPRSLPCGHNFCLECLQRDYASRGNLDRYPCPYCRQDVQVTSDGIAGFGCNILVKNLLEVMELHLTTNDLCKVCRIKIASSTCLTCGSMLCDSCADVHSQHLSTHPVLSLEELRQGHYDDVIRARQSCKCPTHNEPFKYYCRECQSLVCIDCLNLGICNHADGRCTIEKAANEAKEKLKTAIGELEDENATLTAKEKQNSHNTMVSSNALVAVEKTIKNHFEKLVTPLRTAKDKCLKETKSKYAEKQLDRDAFVKQNTHNLATRTSLKQQGQCLVQYGTPTEMLMLDQHILQEIQDLGKIQNENVPQPFITQFHPNTEITNTIDKLCKSFGEIHVMKIFDTCRPDEKKTSAITGLCVLPNNDILAVDCRNDKVKRYDNTGTFMSEIKDQRIKIPWNCIHTTDDELKLSGILSKNISTLTGDGQVTCVLPIGKRATGLAQNSKKQIIVTNDTPPGGVQMYTETGELLWEVDKNEKGEHMFKEPMFVTVNSRDEIILTDRKLNTLYILSEGGKLLKQYYPHEEHMKLSHPCGVCVDREDNIYVADQNHHRVILLTPGGEYRKEVLTKDDGLTKPVAVTFDNQGHLVVSQSYGGLGKTDGVFRQNQESEENCGVFISLNKIRLNKTANKPRSPPGENGEQRGHMHYKSPHKGDRVVWFSDSGPEHGILKWIGKLPDSFEGQRIAGVEFDNEIGTGNGKYKDIELFKAKYRHASLVPIVSLIREDDFNGTISSSDSLNPCPAYAMTNNKSLQEGDRIVWYSDSGPEHGVVKWIGILPDSSDGQLIAGVEFDNKIGTGNGKYKDRQLFKAKYRHASFVPIVGLIREDDFYAVISSSDSLISCSANAMDEDKMEKDNEKKTDKMYTLLMGRGVSTNTLQKMKSEQIDHHSIGLMSYTQLTEFLSMGDILAVRQLRNGLLKSGKDQDDYKLAKRHRPKFLQAIREKFKNRNKPDTD